MSAAEFEPVGWWELHASGGGQRSVWRLTLRFSTRFAGNDAQAEAGRGPEGEHGRPSLNAYSIEIGSAYRQSLEAGLLAVGRYLGRQGWSMGESGPTESWPREKQASGRILAPKAES